MIADKTIFDETPSLASSINSIVAEGGKVIKANSLEDFASNLADFKASLEVVL